MQSLKGTVSGASLNKENEGEVLVAVALVDLEGTTDIVVPVPRERAKAFGIGAEVEFVMRKRRQPKKTDDAAANNGATAAAGGRARRTPAAQKPTTA